MDFTGESSSASSDISMAKVAISQWIFDLFGR